MCQLKKILKPYANIGPSLRASSQRENFIFSPSPPPRTESQSKTLPPVNHQADYLEIFTMTDINRIMDVHDEQAQIDSYVVESRESISETVAPKFVDLSKRLPLATGIHPILEEQESRSGEKPTLEALSEFACMQLEQMGQPVHPSTASITIYGQHGQRTSFIPQDLYSTAIPTPHAPHYCMCDRCQAIDQHLHVLYVCIQNLRHDIEGLQHMGYHLEEILNEYKQATSGNISCARDASDVRAALTELNGHLVLMLRSVVGHVDQSVTGMPTAIQTTLKRIIMSLPSKVTPPNAAGPLAEYGDQMRILIAGIFGMTRRLYEINAAYTKETQQSPRH